MSNGKPVEEDEERVSEIEERIERLRRLHGWASDTRMVPPEEVQSVVAAVDGEKGRSKPSTAVLVLRYSLPGSPQQKVELTEEHLDIGSGDKAKLRVLHASISARHCRVSRDGDSFRVRDMNTQTGTWVNDTRIPLSSPLADGDTLRCGEIDFIIEIRSNEPAQSSPPAPAPTPVAAPVAQAAPPQPQPTRTTQRPVAPEPERTVAVHVMEEAPKPKTTEDDHRAAPKAREAITVAPARAFVVYFDAEGNENEMEIPHDRPLVVGRRSTADLRMQDHGISSMHAAFEWVDGGLAVRDLGSTNGTWVHGERVPRATLQDQDVVRLGLVPVRVRFLAPVVPDEVDVDEIEDEPRWEEAEEEAEAEPEPARSAHSARPEVELADHEDALMPMPEEPGPAVWHLLFVTDNGTIACVNVDEHDNCVVAGEGPVEISVSGRGLKSEHLQFDWAESGLQVMQARRDAPLKVNDEAANEVTLKNGDVVSAGSLIIRVVRGPTAAATAQSGGYTNLHQKWAGHFKRLDPELELLFIDPEAAGGRAELSVWGDGMAQVDVHTGASHERYTARLDQDFQRLLLKALTRSGFPDLPHGARRNSVAGPELHAFWAEDRSDVVLSDWLAATSSAWREVRDLLRAIVDHIIG